MNDTVTSTSEFILRRLQQPFPYSTPSSSSLEAALVIAMLFGLGAFAFLFTVLRRGTDKWYDPIGRLFFSRNQNSISALHAGFWRAAFFVLPAFCLGLSKFGSVASSVALWWMLTVGMFIIASMLTIVSYLRDSQTSRYWTFLLIPLRIAAYAVIAAAFMLPAWQKSNETSKRSRVIILIDVSPSITEVTDEVSQDSSRKAPTRLQKLVDLLTDRDVDLIGRLTQTNPVYVYRFGSRLDDEPTLMTAVDEKNPAWTKEQWLEWSRYDFRPYAIQGVDEATRKRVEQMPKWREPNAGTAEWALQWSQLKDDEFPPNTEEPGSEKAKQYQEQLALLIQNRNRLSKRVDTARALILGTNVSDSLLTTLTRESTNMVQGILVFTDGRSNMGSEGSFVSVVESAAKNKIPIFTIAVGEPRENISLAITDLQAPARTAPDEPFKITVGVDGVGLVNQEALIKLHLYAPGKDPKKGDKADYTIPDDLPVPPTEDKPKNNGRLVFAPGEPPSGQVEFEIDPSLLPAELLEEKKKTPVDPKAPKSDTPAPKSGLQLKTGAWTVVASTPRHPKEVFPERTHTSLPRIVQVLDRPMRVLLVSSGPTREYQTLRTLLAREMDENRAELCVYLQNEGGTEGSIVQDVPPKRLLTRFPDMPIDVTGTKDTEETKFYNLANYDLLILVDPDWEEKDKTSKLRIPDLVFENLRTWVDNLGGGIIYVAGPIHTFQLARVGQDGQSRLRPLLDVLPVIPEDLVVVKTGGIPRDPRRLRLKPSADFDVLKLKEDVLDNPTAGWEEFFTGRIDRVSENEPNYLKPIRGIFSAYPIKDRKPSATVLAEFLAVDEKGQAVPRPYIVVNQPIRGRTAWLGSGEFYRLLQINRAYYDRFWIKLARWVSANRDVRTSRGGLLVNKQFTAGNPVRFTARVLNTDGKPYAKEQDLKLIGNVFQLNQNGDVVKTFPGIKLEPKKGGVWDGYYNGQIPAGVLPAGERFRVVVDNFPDARGEKFEEDFAIKQANPELDNTLPDYATLQRLASPVKDVEARISNQQTVASLASMSIQQDAPVAVDPAKPPEKKGEKTSMLTGREKLAFKIKDTERIKLIPECIDSKFLTGKNRGAIDDIWDRKYDPATHVPEVVNHLCSRLFGKMPLWALYSLLTILVGVALYLLAPRPTLIFPIVILAALLYHALPHEMGTSFKVGIAIFLLVALVSTEWMLRKLIRLA